MRTRPKFLWAALAAGCCFSHQAYAQPSDVEIERGVIETAAGERAVGRGIYAAPLFHARPDEGVLPLPFLRFRSTAETPGPPLFLLAGGPGGTYTDDLDGEDFNVWLDALLEIGDVVMLEQRGGSTTGSPLDCRIRADLDPADLLTQEIYTRFLVAGVTDCRDAHAAAGHDLEAYTIREMADDQNGLRRALGYPEFNIMGGSFGSQLGLTIARRHDEVLHRAVFYGVEGPDNTLDDPVLIDGHVDRVSAALDESWQVRLATGGFRTALEALINDLAADPIAGRAGADDRTVRVGAYDLKLMLWSESGMKGYRDGIARIGQLMIALSLGYEAPLLDAKQALVGMVADEDGLSLNLMTFLVDCGTVPADARDSDLAAGEPDLLFDYDVVDAEVRAICRALGIEPLEDFVQPITASTPMVLVAGGLDGFTPPDYARAVHQSTQESALVYAPLGDHDGWEILASDPRLFGLTLDFLAGRAAVDAFPETVELAPLKARLAPSWAVACAALLGALMLAGLGVLLVRTAGRFRRSGR